MIAVRSEKAELKNVTLQEAVFREHGNQTTEPIIGSNKARIESVTMHSFN